MKVLLSLLMIAAMTAGCKNKEKAAAEKRSTAQTEMTESNEKRDSGSSDIQVMELAEFDKGDGYNIESIELKGDEIYISVNYSGGCEEHEFTLFADPRIMKSMPPQQNIVLKHNSNGDKCRAHISETHVFNLSPIKIGEEGVIVLRLFEYEETITYTYK